jgi:decaprenylphospho-beta-D-erythro-pentofuranosid-2-ulose 2-reductase
MAAEAKAVGHPGRPGRILLLGGTSEIGLAILAALPLAPGTEVLLAGRPGPRLDAAAWQVKGMGGKAWTLPFDATATSSHDALISDAFAAGPVSIVISAAGILVPQEVLNAHPDQAGVLLQTNLTGHITTLLAAAAQLRRQGSGVIVILSSAAAVRPRRANFVYGAAKAGLDAFGRGLADALHGSGVRVLLVRPGFVTGRMTAGLPPQPLATTPAQVGAAVAGALARGSAVAWVPRRLAVLAPLLRLIPRPAWRRLRR